MAQFKDITGQVFGRLTALYFLERVKRLSYWYCQCDCGNKAHVTIGKLTTGWTQSCGCLHKETTGAINRRHGMSETNTYRIWSDMRNRCQNSSNYNFHKYGARGITVCERWQVFENFLADMGERPSVKHSVERRNNDLGYLPDNCYWATAKEQANNHRNNHLLTYAGETLTMQQWCDRLGINQGTLNGRLNRHHWSVEKALSTPVKAHL